jgi:hypothetical protein
MTPGKKNTKAFQTVERMGKHCKTVSKAPWVKSFLPHRGERSRKTPRGVLWDLTPKTHSQRARQASPFLPPTEKKRRKMITKGLERNPSRAHRSPRRRDSFRVFPKSVHFHLNFRNKGSEQRRERGLAEREDPFWRKEGGQEGNPPCPTNLAQERAASHSRNRTVHPTFDKKEPHL